MALNASSDRPRPVPPPLPPRPRSISVVAPQPSTVHEAQEIDASSDTSSLSTPDTDADVEEQELSEQQLRELYDNEEIERFLRFFSAYVTEVRAPQTRMKGEVGAKPVLGTTAQINFATDTTQDGEWRELNASPGRSEPDITVSKEQRSVSEIIALDYIRPILPPQPASPPAFTLAQVRLAAQRLYMAIEPIYMPTIRKCIRLSVWEDRSKSAWYCTAYWTLWFYNLILPGAILSVLYTLLCRRIFPYPTLKELRARRNEDDRASAIGEYIQARLSSGSSLGVKDVWRLIKATRIGRKTKASKTKAPAAPPVGADPAEPAGSGHASVTDEIDIDTEEEKDLKLGASVLEVITAIADNHERLKNIFIWRDPAASSICGALMFVLFLVTLLVPTRYIIKTALLIVGVLYWHVVPILASLPPADLARFPPALQGVPTDADYAMALISQRVAAGLEVKPTNTYRARREKRQSQAQAAGSSNLATGGTKEDTEIDVDWKKWGERAARSKAWMDGGKRVLTGKAPGQLPPSPFASRAIGANSDSHTYPVQHSSAPGLITLTPTTLLFSNIVSSQVKFSIPFAQIQGVKKGGIMGGIMNGLSIRWTTEGGEERVEKFHWVGGRDDLFARLIAVNSRQWIRG